MKKQPHAIAKYLVIVQSVFEKKRKYADHQCKAKNEYQTISGCFCARVVPSGLLFYFYNRGTCCKSDRDMHLLFQKIVMAI